MPFLGQNNNQLLNPVLWGTSQIGSNEGRLIWPLSYVVTAPSMTTGPQTINLSQVAMSTIESILIDNTANTNPLTVSISPTGQNIIVKPQTSQIAPFLCPGGAFTINYTFNAPPAITAPINILLMNYPNAPQEWSAGIPTGQIILPGYTFGKVNYNLVALTGSPQLLFAGNVRRAAVTVTFGNTSVYPVVGLASLEFDTVPDTVAFIGPAQTFSFGLQGNAIWQGPIYVHAAGTSGTPVMAGAEFTS